MSHGWEDHEPAPLEYFHSRLMHWFHEHRLNNYNGQGARTVVSLDGSDMAKIIAKAKIETYKKYPKQVSDKAILKADL